MDRLHTEWHRLFLHPDAPSDGPPASRLAGPDHSVRAAVLGLSGAEGWSALSTIWRGVQDTLGLPPPAIAVDGAGAGQLWFAFSHPLPAAEAAHLLQALCQRWAASLPASRLRIWPGAGGTTSEPPALPPAARGPERWAAFLSPDLAPLFAEEPWLDHPPGADAQADLLSRLAPIHAAELAHALTQLAHAQVPGHALVTRPDTPPATWNAAPVPAREAPPTLAVQAAAETADPRRFLTAVMQDAGAPLALRVEAAKALLQACGSSRA